MCSRQPTALPSLPDSSCSAILIAVTSGSGRASLSVADRHLPGQRSAPVPFVVQAPATGSPRASRNSIRLQT